MPVSYYQETMKASCCFVDDNLQIAHYYYPSFSNYFSTGDTDKTREHPKIIMLVHAAGIRFICLQHRLITKCL
jgi:hypothetical protein